MKKILGSLLFVSLILSSCSIDWNNDKNKKITELENQIKNLKIKNQSNNLDLQDKCSKKAKEIFNEQYPNPVDASYENHYSTNLNKCFVKISSLKTFGDVIWNYSTIYDSYEGKIFADYAWHTDKVKKYWEVKPVICEIEDGYCNTTEEFDEKIKKYMEN